MDLQDNEAEILRIFSKKAKEIANHVIFQESRINVGINVKTKPGEPTHVRITGPNDQELLPIVPIVRQLYMENEVINFSRVYNIVYQYLAQRDTIDPQIIDGVKSAMSGFKKILKRDELPITIRLKEKVLGPREIVNIWFNGNIFHSDLHKVRTYRKLWTAPTGPIADFVFRSTIVGLASLMIYLGSIIDRHVLCEKQNS